MALNHITSLARSLTTSNLPNCYDIWKNVAVSNVAYSWFVDEYRIMTGVVHSICYRNETQIIPET